MEEQFAQRVEALVSDPERHESLVALLKEDHPAYDQQGTAAVVRMRGWILLALARVGVSEEALLFVLEELDAGMDAYLIAAAARALRSYRQPDPAFAPLVMRALGDLRYHDEPVSFDGYGAYSDSSDDTSPVRELLATLAWLGPEAGGVLAEVESLRGPGGLPKSLQCDVDRAVEAIDRTGAPDEAGAPCCCRPPGSSQAPVEPESRPTSKAIGKTVLQDQEGSSTTFEEFFRGRPSIVVFFYSRCDNPLKCSLTVTKLARVQRLLEERGLADQIQTAAITYDPEFDTPERLSGYGQDRSVRMNARHKMLRTPNGIEPLRRHFGLGVNFIESLVNRHRIEAYVLDEDSRIAGSFHRIRWDEEEVVERAVELLREAPPLG